MGSCDNEILFVDEIINIETLSIRSPEAMVNEAKEEKVAVEDLVPSNSEGDSGNGTSSPSSAEDSPPVNHAVDEDVILIANGLEERPQFSLKNWSRIKRQGQFPRYCEKNGPVRNGEGGRDGPCRPNGQERVVREEARPESRFAGSVVKIRVPRKSAPVVEKCGFGSEGTVIPVKAASPPPTRSWFKRNVADNFRCVSAPPNMQPPYDMLTDDGDQAGTEAGQNSRPTSADLIVAAVPVSAEDGLSAEVKKSECVVLVDAASDDAAILEIEGFCASQGIALNGGVNVVSEEGGRRKIELNVADAAIGRSLVKKFDGFRIAGNMLRVRLKPDPKTDIAQVPMVQSRPPHHPRQPNFPRTKRHHYENEKKTHKELDDELALFFANKRVRRSEPPSVPSDPIPTPPPPSPAPRQPTVLDSIVID